MVMGSKEKIENIKPDSNGEIYTCPTCGYTDGFHVSFQMKAGMKTAGIVLICPTCSARFRVGWSVEIDSGEA